MAVTRLARVVSLRSCRNEGSVPCGRFSWERDGQLRSWRAAEWLFLSFSRRKNAEFCAFFLIPKCLFLKSRQPGFLYGTLDFSNLVLKSGSDGKSEFVGKLCNLTTPKLQMPTFLS